MSNRWPNKFTPRGPIYDIPAPTHAAISIYMYIRSAYSTGRRYPRSRRRRRPLELRCCTRRFRLRNRRTQPVWLPTRRQRRSRGRGAACGVTRGGNRRQSEQRLRGRARRSGTQYYYSCVRGDERRAGVLAHTHLEKGQVVSIASSAAHADGVADAAVADTAEARDEGSLHRLVHAVVSYACTITGAGDAHDALQVDLRGGAHVVIVDVIGERRDVNAGVGLPLRKKKRSASVQRRRVLKAVFPAEHPHEYAP